MAVILVEANACSQKKEKHAVSSVFIFHAAMMKRFTGKELL